MWLFLLFNHQKHILWLLSHNDRTENQSLYFHLKGCSFYIFLSLLPFLPKVQNTSVLCTYLFEIYKPQKFWVTMAVTRKSDIEGFLTTQWSTGFYKTLSNSKRNWAKLGSGFKFLPTHFIMLSNTINCAISLQRPLFILNIVRNTKYLWTWHINIVRNTSLWDTVHYLLCFLNFLNCGRKTDQKTGKRH